MHYITDLYHGSLYHSNFKGYKVIDSFNTSKHGVALQSAFKGVIYLTFTPFATMV